MSALRDWDFPVHFYFGNAAQDLSHLMPNEDEQNLSLESRLNNLENVIQQLSDTQEHISFYLRDILRMTH